MKYGTLPVSLGIFKIECTEMLFYQYMPIKLEGQHGMYIEERLSPFYNLVHNCCEHFKREFGDRSYLDSYIYLTAKHLFQAPGCSFNRPGYHSDGFLTNDINYIWCDRDPTVFNISDYSLMQDHEKSLVEMEAQSLPEKECSFKPFELLRLDQFNIHKVAEVEKPGMRTFFKLSFSTEKYNLIGNSRNYSLDYDWDMKPREETRNHPIK